MNFNQVMELIEKDMQLPENSVAGEFFLNEISDNESFNMLKPEKLLEQWEFIKVAPDLYEFLSLCGEVKMDFELENISEKTAIMKIQNLGSYHKGFPTEVEILEFLYDDEVDI